jgi:molecular chaperone DnaK
LKEYGDKLSESNKSAISSALENLKKAHQAQDLAGIEAAMNTLNEAWQAAASEMYQATNGAPGSGPDAGAQGGGPSNAGNASGNNVSDVEYEEVNDKK